MIQAMYESKNKALRSLGSSLARVIKKLMSLYDTYLQRSRKKLPDGTYSVKYWYYNGHTIESGSEDN